ncbi:hypothetical protein [Virgibacillus sp. Bac332]|uniref:hypothetical protein n=1 Tax=Virgibacillus sp. Bac332 TaxID=2419842 RepID=UPI000EF4DDCD|nr:hypothetical protein [Virgibacillus sp. Bac332]
MCKHGTEKYVTVNDKKKAVPIDACIANEIEYLNKQGIITLGCCCGHGKSGQVVTIDNGVRNKWREQVQPPHTLLKEESVDLARNLGYSPYPYHYVDNGYQGVWQMQLKTGCITEDDVNRFHEVLSHLLEGVTSEEEMA